MAKKSIKTTTETSDTSLVLRVCKADMSSRGGYRWPSKVGEIAIAPDWTAEKECGQGLHGWLYGQGELCTDYWTEEGAKWMVLEVVTSEIIMLGGKCKFPRATVRFIGKKHEATAFLVANEPRSASVAVIGNSVIVGESQLAIVGALGTATAGDSGTATAGDSGTATAGEYGVICVKYYDEKEERYRFKVGDIGENGLLPNVAYRLNDKNQFQVVK